MLYIRAMYKLVSFVGERTLYVPAATTLCNDTRVIRPLDYYRTATLRDGLANAGSLHTR